MSFQVRAESILKVFNENHIHLEIKSNYMVAKDCTTEKIESFVAEAGRYCPLFSSTDLSFTVVPYALPRFFNNKYISKAEITELLKDNIYTATSEVVEDEWERVNHSRKLVVSSLSKGISELVSKYVESDHPIIEIGSGIGYTLSKRLSEITLRIQPSQSDCQLLSQTISEPIYQLDIEGVCQALVESEQKVPLIFAVNVFDTLSASARKTSFSQISKIQNLGDRLLILMDSNPEFKATFKYLESLYPEYAIYPYFPPIQELSKLSVILVPVEYVNRKPSLEEVTDIFIETFSTQERVKFQAHLTDLKNKHGLKVIALEDIFVEQIKEELKESGYSAEVYYHTSFVLDPLTKVSNGVRQQDIIYRPVTDTVAYRQWDPMDDRFLKGLYQKGLNFTTKYFKDLKQSGKKIIGAELLVIDAKKSQAL